jgi:tetratricopeptide (TPR) repeat protein
MHRIALESVRAVGNRQGEAWVLNNLGDALGVTRDSEAISCLEQSLAIRRETGDRGGEAQAVNNLADAYEELGRREEAVALLQRAVDLNREAHHPYGEAVALSNLGAALLHVNRAREAAGVLEEACAVFARLNSANGIGYALHNLGECYLSLGRTDEAIDCLQRAVATHQATGNKLQQAVSLRTLSTAQQRGALAIRARASRTQAADILDELGDHERAAELRAEHRNLTSTMQWPANLAVQTLVRI